MVLCLSIVFISTPDFNRHCEPQRSNPGFSAPFGAETTRVTARGVALFLSRQEKLQKKPNQGADFDPRP